MRRRSGRGLRGTIQALRTRIRLAGEFRPYLRGHARSLALAIVLAIAYAGLRMLEPWPLQILIDTAVLDKDTSIFGLRPLHLVGGDKPLLVLISAATVLVIAALSGSVYYVQSILVARVGQDIVRSLREDLFHQLQRLSLPFHRRAEGGDLLMRMTGDMILLREMIMATLVTLTTHLLLLVSALALMATVSAKLTLVAVVLAPILYALFRFFRGRMVEAARRQRRREGKLAASLGEVLLAIPMVQSFTAEKAEDDRFRKISKKSARAGLRAARLEAGMQRMVEVVIAIGTALVLYAGTREILDGRLTPGVFLVFLAYLRGLYKPLRGLSKVAERTARASAATERVLEVLRAPRGIKDAHDAVPAPLFRGQIRFLEVDFSYEDGTEALRDVDFEIQPGEAVALVGPTGAGKSTLFSLLLRFHKPTRGKVRIDGVSLKRYTLESLRRQIAYLPQEPFILGLSVRENLLYGKPDATDEELWEALTAVRLDRFVRSLPGGLDARIQPRGQSLSGGQKQRLAIARAMLKDAPILLLDEPTTGLDPRTTREVLEGLGRLRRDRTTITIAHHLSTVRAADRVLVLDRGRLVEDGPPEELLARDSLFRLFAEIQGLTGVQSGDAPGRISATGSSPAPPPDQEREIARLEASHRPPGGDEDGGDRPAAREAGAGDAIPQSRLEPGLMHDEAVKGVVLLLDEKGARRFARSLDASIPLAGPLRLLPVKQRIGQRALLRIEEAGPRGRVWYAKLTRGRRTAQNEQLRLLAERAWSIGVGVPAPVAILERFRAVILDAAPGTALIGPGDEGPSAGTRQVADLNHIYEAVGLALARLHDRLPELATRSDREGERDRLERAREKLDPAFRERLRSLDHLIDAWTRSAERVGRGETVTLHGDLHPSQILHDPFPGGKPALWFLDWDEACRGEAERDVGNFLAHLILERHRGRLDSSVATDLAMAFRSGYAARRRIDDGRLRWYLEGSLLRLAILHADPRFGAVPPNPPELSDALLAEATQAASQAPA